jgi:antitoxin (DNA-binding transcriptional repressor) of toxin-antitoxin stability system
MKILEMKQATASLAEYARGVKSEPVILTVAGKPVAALVAIENADAETVSLSTNPRFLALIERSRARQSAEGGITGPEMRRRLGLRRTASTRSR